MIKDALWNGCFKAVGLAFLVLGKAKHVAKGYSRTRPISTADARACVEYDVKVVDEWLEVLQDYTGESAAQIKGRRILELGPGADFGVPLYLLSKGVGQYSSIDAFPLALQAPSELHDVMLERIGRMGSEVPVSVLKEALPSNRSGRSGRAATLQYVAKEDFDIASTFRPDSFDFIFSQAAFEHFDDVDDVIRQVSQVARSGARLVAGVDLQTHARWLREKDPLNIYRFSERIYRFLGFRTMPNRMSVSDYERILTKYGWECIEFKNVSAVDNEYFERVKSALHPAFRKDETRTLWFVVCATRARIERA